MADDMQMTCGRGIVELVVTGSQPGLVEKQGLVILSTVFRAVFPSTTPQASVAAVPLSPEQEEVLRRCNVYRKSFPMMEIALPAMALRNRGVAKWVGATVLRSICARARSS